MTKTIIVQMQTGYTGLSDVYMREWYDVDRRLNDEIFNLFKTHLGKLFEREEDLREYAEETFFMEFDQNVKTYKEEFRNIGGSTYTYQAYFVSEFQIEGIPDVTFVCYYETDELVIRDYKHAGDYDEINEKLNEWIAENEEDEDDEDDDDY